MKNYWELIVGLEVHAQLNTTSKLFSRSSTQFGEEANTQVSFIDAAMPGMLPALNKKCVALAVKAGLALKGRINRTSYFDRKNYFYPDSPQGYQISQFFCPIMQNGRVSFIDKSGVQQQIKIDRIHMEQDAGKSIHDQYTDLTLIDLNRVGIPLIEIVTAPDFRDPEDAVIFLKKLRNILLFCDICDGNLERGSMRCDANVSIRKKGSTTLGTRVEVKNLNSFKNIYKAIISESERQIYVLEEGKEVLQETRLYDVDNNATRSMRTKEAVQEYRYFPDPDLLPVQISHDFIDNIKSTIPELPEEKKKRYVQEMGISNYYAEVITAEKKVSIFFDVVSKKSSPKLSASWLVDELFGRLNKMGIPFQDSPITSNNFISLIKLLETETISGKIAKEVMDKMLIEPGDANKIVQKYNLVQISDYVIIEGFINKVINDNKSQIIKYQSGQKRLFGFFVGQVMRESKGKLNPQIVNDILQDKLK